MKNNTNCCSGRDIIQLNGEIIYDEASLNSRKKRKKKLIIKNIIFAPLSFLICWSIIIFYLLSIDSLIPRDRRAMYGSICISFFFIGSLILVLVPILRIFYISDLALFKNGMRFPRKRSFPPKNQVLYYDEIEKIILKETSPEILICKKNGTLSRIIKAEIESIDDFIEYLPSHIRIEHQ